MVNDFPLRNEIVKILCHRNNKYKGSSSAKKKLILLRGSRGRFVFYRIFTDIHVFALYIYLLHLTTGSLSSKYYLHSL